MEFTWDPQKRDSNLRKHGSDFTDAEEVFRGAVFSFEDRRFRYGEQRFIALGLLRDTVMLIAYTEPDETSIRVLSMRKANKNEQQTYFANLSD
jgi:hypothetical protein